MDLIDIFSYHRPDEAGITKIQNIREAAIAFAQTVLDNTPRCADQTAAVRKIREAMMTANAAVALDGKV